MGRDVSNISINNKMPRDISNISSIEGTA